MRKALEGAVGLFEVQLTLVLILLELLLVSDVPSDLVFVQIRRYSHNTPGPRNSGRTTSLSFSTAPGGSGSHSCPSGTRSSWPRCTWGARSAACGCGPALPYPPLTRYPSDGTDPAGSAQFLAGSFRTTPCDGTSEGSRRDTYNPTSRGIGSANLSWRSSCPTG